MLLFSVQAVPAPRCGDLFHVAVKTTSVKEYPYFIDGIKNPEKSFQFGFESEYTFDEIAPLLKKYKPKSFNVKTWETLTDDQRRNYIKTSMENNIGGAAATGSGLELYKPVSGASQLPKELSVDTTGNLEIILPPIDSYAEYKQNKDAINKAFGVGSMQSTISIPWKEFFQSLRKKTGRENLVREDLANVEGFFNMTSEMDTFNKLLSGYERLQNGTKNLVARSFQHLYVGPVNSIKQEYMYKYMIENGNGNKTSKEELQLIRAADASFKYSGSTVYRPDIATTEALVWEIRDAHKDNKYLESKIERNIKFFQSDLEKYSAAVKLKAFDRAASFENLPPKAQFLLENVISYKKGDPDLTPKAVENLKYYKNFAWPMRDWSAHVEILGLNKKETNQIKQMQWSYANKLIAIADKLEKKSISKDEAKFEIHAALVTFAHEIDISQKLIELDQFLLNSNQQKLKRVANGN